ncbi:nucleotidyltransferase family protein [Oscillibacter valericigenes]|nr:nucleotidyltransferase family protein [Oscillibacter valericigenes]
MRTAGIICEYNPFHRGHAWQIDALRAQLGADTAVVCAMSGNFVQRGDFAILRAHARAEAAVRGGADLVLELPLPWAISSAEGFAAGGVGVLTATGAVDTLVFGSECGDTETLRAVAAVLESDAFAALLRQRLAEGTSFAAAREAAARELLGDRAAVLAQPNDILGVEYCKAIARQNAVMEPLALARKSVGHDGGAVEGFASASHIRRLLISGGNAAEFLTPESADIYARECAAGRAPVTMANAERAILARLRALTEADFAACDSGGEGLYHRFYDAVQHETSIEDILAAAKSKRYAHARLRRLLLSAFLGLTAELPARIPYLRVLACNERGREVLKTMKTTAAAPILTKSAQVRRLDADAQRLFALTARAEEQYTLAYPSLAAAKPGSAWTTTPVIL